MREMIICRGHANIRPEHRTTLEVTKDSEVGPGGDCIIGVGADRGLADFDISFRERIREGARMRISITAGDVCDVVTAWGDSGLGLSHPRELVVRKSNFVSERTLGVRADKAAADLKAELKELLDSPEQEIGFLIELD